MSHLITLPELGEGITSGNIVNFRVAEGETITAGQPLVEVETDKAIVEVPAPTNGRIKKFLVKVGETAKVGAPLLELEQIESSPTNKDLSTAPSQPLAETTPATIHTPHQHSQLAQGIQDTLSSTEPITVLLPGLGEGINGGNVVSLRLKPGETILAGQALLDVETDKAIVEVPSPQSGTLEQYLVKPGEHIHIHQPIARIIPAPPVATAKESPPSISLSEQTPGAVPAPSMPPTDHVTQAVAERPTDTTAQPSSLQTAHSYVASRSEAGAYGAALPRAERIIPAGPATRRFARELGVDLSLIPGTGPGGRITIDDVKHYVKTHGVGRSSNSLATLQAPQLPDFSLWGEIERQPLSNLRRRIVEQMQQAWTIPMVTQFDQADITELEAFRKRNAPVMKERGFSLTITVFVIKAAVAALKKFPHFNSSLDLTRGELILKKYYHIGIAVDTPAGLIVPVIRDADKKPLSQLCSELADLANKARERKVTPNELQGASFTISNLGGIGGTQFTPLVNPPQVAILGIARAEWRPRWNGTTFEPRLIMPLSVSYDHRVVDGADGARFTRAVGEALENYAADLLF